MITTNIVSTALNAISTTPRSAMEAKRSLQDGQVDPHLNGYGNGNGKDSLAAFVSLRLPEGSSYDVSLERDANWSSGSSGKLEIISLGTPIIMSVEDRGTGQKIDVWIEKIESGKTIPTVIAYDKEGNRTFRLRLDMADINKKVNWFVSNGANKQEAMNKVLLSELENVDKKQALEVIAKLKSILTTLTDSAKRSESFNFEYGNVMGADAEKQCGMIFSTDNGSLFELMASLDDMAKAIKRVDTNN